MSQRDKVLIVDDHPLNIEILQDVLDDNYELAMAESGSEALTVASEFKPALVLLDIMMPGIDGYETCRQLRANPLLRHTKIIMVSAKAMASERIEGYEAGADDYITKPFNKEELRAKVRVYLRLKSVEEIDQFKTDTLTLLSHETRTPLNGIIAPVELLREQHDLDAAEREQFFDMIHDSAHKLLRFFDRVITLSRMKGGTYPFQFAQTNLCESVRQAIAEVAQADSVRQVAIESELPDTALSWADAERCQEVVTALLDNAVRFSPIEGSVTIKLERDASHWRLTVVDQGDGIDPAFLPHLFDEFTQPDIVHHSHGQGLSLALAHHIVQAHQGTIQVESLKGIGTTFVVRFAAEAS